jgi:PilZ domain-containing protein
MITVMRMIQPPEPPKPQTAADRRRSLRIAHLTEGVLFADAAATRGAVIHVFDVSRHGVGFKAAGTFPVGTEWRVKIGAGPLHVTGFVKIVHRREGQDGLWSYGAEFVNQERPPLTPA